MHYSSIYSFIHLSTHYPRGHRYQGPRVPRRHHYSSIRPFLPPFLPSLSRHASFQNQGRQVKRAKGQKCTFPSYVPYLHVKKKKKRLPRVYPSHQLLNHSNIHSKSYRSCDFEQKCFPLPLAEYHLYGESTEGSSTAP